MQIIIGVILLTAAYGLAASIVELEYTQLNQHLGAAVATYLVASYCVAAALNPVLMDFEPKWAVTWILYGTQAMVTWLVAQVMARIAYVVTGREASIMAHTVAVCMVLILLFCNWAVRI